MKIASRYRPFSHSPGAACLIPGTSCEVRAYPTAVFVNQFHIKWELNGPVKDFTVVQDLEKQEVVIYGFAKEGYFRYNLFYEEAKIVLRLDRASQGFLKGSLKELKSPSYEIFLKPKETKFLEASFGMNSSLKRLEDLERISFGNHKAQEWELIKRRKDPLEYLPFWFALGQSTPCQEVQEVTGNLLQLELCKEFLQKGNNELFLQQLKELFEVGFEALLMPKLYDTQYLGLGSLEPQTTREGKPLALLRGGYELIREMLFKVQGDHVFILPHVPAVFHTGRCLNFRFGKAFFHVEWSKKLLKKVKIISHEKQTLHLCFQKVLKSFRLRKTPSNKERKCFSQDLFCGVPVELEKGEYLLDHFKK